MAAYRILLNMGSLGGLISFVLFLIYYYAFGMNPLGNISWLSAWIPFVFVYMGVKRYREDQLEGFMTFGQAFKGGIIVGFVYATLSAMLIYLYGAVVDGGFVDLFKADQLEELAKAKEMMLKFVGKDIYKEAIAEIEKSGVGSLAQSDLFNKLIGTLIVSLLMAFVMKRPKPVFDQPDGE